MRNALVPEIPPTNSPLSKWQPSLIIFNRSEDKIACSKYARFQNGHLPLIVST